ncbi:MAG: phosphate ABC transporter substrate-binding protein PstS [Chitinivibrionales bacterium]|nr:phosphate ABC transporter substrate-binding protein PstS [Chitinivibrionales bacterium]
MHILLLAGMLTAGPLEILGAGATFSYPLYSKMFSVYSKEKDVRINYQPIGSGGGIRQLQNKTVDFGGTDAFISEEELNKFDKILHIPVCLGAVAITYNIPGNPMLKLTPEIIADIFMGKITAWNNEKIKRINPDIKLPKLNIIIVHRADASGTTFIFTDYLSKISPLWKQMVGRGKAVNWPKGLGAKGNEAVTGLVKQLPGSIGYCELAYTIQNNMARAQIQNASGNFIAPSLESTIAAAPEEVPEDTRVTLTNTSNENGYPIIGFTWVILYKDQKYKNRSKVKAKALVDLLWWMTHEGQKFTKALDYAPLPAKVVPAAEKLISSVTYGEQKIKK